MRWKRYQRERCTSSQHAYWLYIPPGGVTREFFCSPDLSGEFVRGATPPGVINSWTFKPDSGNHLPAPMAVIGRYELYNFLPPSCETPKLLLITIQIKPP